MERGVTTEREAGSGPARDGESFLSRWSRRKQAAREEELVEAPPPAPPSAPQAVMPAAVASEPVELPPIDSLNGLESDYSAFFRQPIEDGLRRAALKKLFVDPHFNAMDGLDVYIEDYTQFEPLEEPLRRQLLSATQFANQLPEIAPAPAAAMPDAAPSPEGGSVPTDAPPLPTQASDGDGAAGETAPAPPAEDLLTDVNAACPPPDEASAADSRSE